MKRPMIPVAVLFLLVALLRGYIYDREMVGAYVPETFSRCSLEGKVYHKTDDSVYLKDLIFIIEDAPSGHREIPVKYNLICKTDSAGDLRLGAGVHVEGSFKEYEEAMNPGEFDVREYYASMGIQGYLTTTCISPWDDKYDRILEGLFRCKEIMRARLGKIFPEKEAGTLTAMLLGDRQDLASEVKTLYKDTGIAHILAISGLHITLLGVGIYRLLKKCGLPPGAAAGGGMIIMLAYGLMTGMGVSSCRAIGMYMLRMYSKIRQRTADMLTSLCIVAGAMVIFDPLYLRQTSFHMSFLSVCGVSLISLIAPSPDKKKAAQERFDWGIIRKSQGSVRERLHLWQGLVARKWCNIIMNSLAGSMCICIASLPIQLMNYYKIPMFTILVNLLVLPSMSLVAGATLVALVPGLGWVGTASYLALNYIERVCNAFQGLYGLIWNPGRPTSGQVFGYYGALILIVNVYCLLKKRGVKVGWHWLIPLLLPALTLTVNTADKDKLAFLYVGQGDCTVIERATGETYIYDCGSSSRANVGTNVLIPYLLYEGRSDIAQVFVSHADSDHCNGILELLREARGNGIKIESLVLPNLRRDLLSDRFGELIRAAREAEIEVVLMGTGDMIGEDIEILHPDRNYVPESDNSSSLCILMELGEERTILLTGDVDGQGETELVNRIVADKGMDFNVDILKVPHHGSKYATSEGFLAVAQPRLAVIMAGRNNSYGHPHKETLERLQNMGIKVVNTAWEGAVIIEL